MNKPNFSQLFTNCCNGTTTRSKSHVHDPQSHPIQSSQYLSPLLYQPNHSRGLISSDNGICDGMNNCHLTESWAGYMKQQTTLPITQISNNIPILNPYVPLNRPIELKTSTNDILNATLYQQPNFLFNQDCLTNSNYLNHTRNIGVNGQIHTQQQLYQGGFSRLTEFNYDATSNQYNSLGELSADCAMNEHEERVKTSIKFQDRNKKLDFKVNFRDENRKVNGCFHREDSKSPNAVAAPKKKWIRQHMTGNALICITHKHVSNPPTLSE
jgi:hypothetical protein